MYQWVSLLCFSYVILCQSVQIGGTGREFLSGVSCLLYKREKRDRRGGLTTLKDSLLTAEIFFKV